MVTPTPTTVQVKIQLRGDTAANWASVNPVLLTNELGLETDTKKIKVGNGSTAWNSLAYFPFVVSGGTVTGNLEIGTTGTLTFEGSTADGFETTLGVVNPTADRTINLPNVSGTIITTGDTGTVTSTMIADGTIVNADVSASAAIAHNKLATITAGYVLIGNASNVPTATEVTGDVTISSTGVTSISSGSIVDGDVSASAEIAVSKLADGAARQLLQTDAAGTAVEWTDNVDIPGTLDVTSDATFDANVTIEGDLTVNGTTTTIDTETLLVKDKNIELAVVDAPTDTTADGGGITLKGATDKTITWSDTTDAWTSNQPLDLPAGTNALPALFFNGDVNTGIYSPGGDQLAISSNAVQRVNFGTGEVVFNDGGENYDFRIEGDTNSSLFFVDASADAVGIGTTSPLDPLHVEASTTGPALRLVKTTTDTSTIENAILIFTQTSGTAAAGLGSRINFITENSNGIAYETAYISAGTSSSSAGFKDGFISFSTALGVSNPTERIRIDSSGRLLVGTSTYDGNGIAVFNGNSTSSTGAGAIDIRLGTTRPTVADTAIGYLRFMSTSQTSGNNHYASISAWSDGASTSDGDIPGRLVFSTTADGASSPTERMRITQRGAVYARNGTSAAPSVSAASHSFCTNLVNAFGLSIESQATSGNVNGLIITFNGYSPDNNSQAFIVCGDTTANRMTVSSDGDVWTSDAGTLTSDISLKRDVVDVTPKLADVMNLRVRNFYWEEDYHPNKQDKKLIGFIAQEFEQVFPGLVSEHKIKGGDPIFDDSGNDTGEKTPEIYKKGIKEAKLIPILVKAFQEAVERIETLEAEVAALKGA